MTTTSRLFAAISLVACTAAIPTVAGAQGRTAPRAELATADINPVAQRQVRRDVLFAATMPAAGDTLVLPLSAEGDLATRGAALDAATRDAVARAIASAEFRFGARATLSLRGIGVWDRIVVIGLGQNPDLAAVQAVGAAGGRALINEDGRVTVAAEGLSAEQIGELAIGMGIGEYRSDIHRTVDRPTADLGATTIVASAAPAAEAAFRSRGQAIVDAVHWTRDLANEPANIIYPESFVERARAAFAGVRGVTIEVLDVADMERLGMGSLLSVGRGSARPPRMLVVRYQGQGAPEGGPIVLAGKGITFDTGGISLKPGLNMGDMKMDMSGAAAVTGAVLALARSGAPVNVVSIAALAENMPSHMASRPGDVVRTMSGKTIEIINTDAEGRLVLADALEWAQANLNPVAVVDVATLTGAIGTALGDDYAGLFSRHPALADQLDAAGTATGEIMWRMPLHPSVLEDMSSTIADLRNTGTGGGGASFGAAFIGEFLPRTTPWAHIDMANMAYGSATDQRPAGAAGWGVRALERFVRDFRPVPAEAQ